MNKIVCALMCLIAGILVGLSAYIEHGLRESLTEKQWLVTQKAFTYFFIHLLVILAIRNSTDIKLLTPAISLFAMGAILFSMSLYSHALLGFRPVLAPMGGLTLIVAWLFLAVQLFTK